MACDCSTTTTSSSSSSSYSSYSSSSSFSVVHEFTGADSVPKPRKLLRLQMRY